MSRARTLGAAAGLVILLSPAPAPAQSGGSAECAEAEADITRNRLARNPNVHAAVAAGREWEGQCKRDDGFLLAYALARIDLAKQVDQSDVRKRTVAFNEALVDLEQVRGQVLARRSSLYEIFGTLGHLYYETKQYEKAIAVLNSAAPIFPRLDAATQRTILFTRGQAEFQLGRFVEARHSFTRAAKLGHPEAGRWTLKSAKKL